MIFCWLESGLAKRSQPRKDLLRGLFPNAAGVIENDIGFLVSINRAITPRHQHARYFLRIVDVHLAAEGFQVKGLALAWR